MSEERRSMSEVTRVTPASSARERVAGLRELRLERTL